MILSHVQTALMLRAYNKGETEIMSSLDLGKSSVVVKFNRSGVILPDTTILSWHNIKKITKHTNRCYLVENGEIQPLVIYSQQTKLVRSLYPTASAPTTIVGGFYMHRVKHSDPLTDTHQKVKTLGKIKGGRVLDTATGLGYTAIELAKHATSVLTTELDPAAIELAKLNPWSEQLFTMNNITISIEDISKKISSLDRNSYSHILHDPPTFKLAGYLYSFDFYRQMYRILKPKGIVFHYIGDPDTKHGRQVSKGVVDRLRASGFGDIEEIPKAFGIRVVKNR